MSENPKCQYCGKEMDAKCHSVNMYDTKFCFECSCGARSPLKNTPDEAYMAAMKKEDDFNQLYERLRVRHAQGGR